MRGRKTSKSARRRALCATRRKKKGAFRISAKDQLDLFEQNEEYRDFVEKFKPQKTTDDCYTPQPVFDAVADWVANEYGFDRTQFVRPFWPGGDYERADYPDSCVVVDNPPFSILSEIVRFFQAENIRFFLLPRHLPFLALPAVAALITPAVCPSLMQTEQLSLRRLFLTWTLCAFGAARNYSKQ